MKHLSTLFISFFISLSAWAQIPSGGASLTGRISGTIIDSLTQKPVDYATVGLGRSGSTKTTNGSLTDEKGVFKIDNISAGTYRLTISFIGYQTKIIDGVKTTPEKPDLNLGKILVSPSANALKEVVVTGQAAVVENKIDRIVYNAEKDVTVGGGNASDVLRKVPLLSVDMDGNVSLRGSQNVRVLINGKPSGSMANNIADALKMIPADQIKNVEVITSPSAKYDAEGTSGIINIITKKRNAEGISGTIGGGLGLRQNNGNANLNIKKGRLGLTANIGGNGSWPQTTTVEVLRSDAAGAPAFEQYSSSESYRMGYRGSTGLDYDINTYNSITSTLNFNRFKNNFAGEVLSNIYTGGNVTAANSITDRTMRMNGFDWNTDFTHKFKKAGQEWSVAGQLTQNKNIQDYTTTYTGGFRPNEIGNNDAKNQEITAQTDYVHPFKKITLETGAKLILRDITSPTLVQQEISGVYQPSASLSNSYTYAQDVYATYVSLGFSLSKKFQVKLGGRFELTEIEGLSNQSQSFSNTYQNFIPSFVISRSLKNYQTIKLAYNQRIQRPSLFYLNPYRNTADPLNQQEGNPSLSPEVSHNVELGYSTFVKTTVINASLYYRHTQNIIETVVEPAVDPVSGANISLATFKNVGTNNSFGMNLFGSVNPITKLTLRGNLNTYTYNIKTNSAISTLEPKVYLMYNAFLSASLVLKGGFSAETFFILNSPRRTAQGTNPSFNMWNIGFKKEILKKKGSVGINIIDPFNENKHFDSSYTTTSFTQSSKVAIPFRSVGVNFSWSFGKMNFAAQPKKKRGVNNDDLKQGEQSMQ